MKKHQLTAVVLSVIFTGLGLFYIGTPMLIITGACLWRCRELCFIFCC